MKICLDINTYSQLFLREWLISYSLQCLDNNREGPELLVHMLTRTVASVYAVHDSLVSVVLHKLYEAYGV